jgi:hypothetical protein
MSARLPTTPKMPGNENEPLKKGKFVARQGWKEKEKTSMMTFFYDKRREKRTWVSVAGRLLQSPTNLRLWTTT